MLVPPNDYSIQSSSILFHNQLRKGNDLSGNILSSSRLEVDRYW